MASTRNASLVSNLLSNGSGNELAPAEARMSSTSGGGNLVGCDAELYSVGIQPANTVGFGMGNGTRLQQLNSAPVSTTSAPTDAGYVTTTSSFREYENNTAIDARKRSLPNGGHDFDSPNLDFYAPPHHGYHPRTREGSISVSPLGAGAGNRPQGGSENDYPNSPTAGRASVTNILGGNKAISDQTVEWLNDNYEVASGLSLPRSLLYKHYVEYCKKNPDVPAVNAASFGKMIRSVFPLLKTRRLGTRGNSKYHYYGIRVRASSPLYAQYIEMEQEKEKDLANATGGPGHCAVGRQRAQGSQKTEGGRAKNGAGSDTANRNGPDDDPEDGYVVNTNVKLPDFPELVINELPVNTSQENVNTFKMMYRAHSQRIADVIVHTKFEELESLWRHFWQKIPPHLESLLETEAVAKYVENCDGLVYSTLVDCLMPDVLKPIPVSLTHAVRQSAKNLEDWLDSAMDGLPEIIADAKRLSVSQFSQTLRRNTSLNHLAQAARAVLQNKGQIEQMLTDLMSVDFSGAHDQAAWLCQCDRDLVESIEQEFKANVEKHASLEEFASWLNDVSNRCLAPHFQDERFPSIARSFLMKWSFYSSLVIRDLTLRSASSFGSFHLMRLLYDEYIFYLVERHICKNSNSANVQRTSGDSCEDGESVNSLESDLTSEIGAGH
eukprot:Nk52_evm4s271 gene=Nk52_evmTU4s271